MPFRDAYKKVGAAIEAGNFTHAASPAHTHEGSIGNLCNDKIEAMMHDIIQKFNFDKVKIVLQQLLS
jgi:argininosuccinate lyase